MFTHNINVHEWPETKMKTFHNFDASQLANMQFKFKWYHSLLTINTMTLSHITHCNYGESAM